MLFRRTLLLPVAMSVFAGSFAVVMAQSDSSATAAKPNTADTEVLGEAKTRLPRKLTEGADLPNGWRITPAGKVLHTIGFLPGYRNGGNEGYEIDKMGDLVLNLIVSPDGQRVIATHGGWFPNGIDVYDTKTQKQTQHLPLPASWLGLAWSADGRAFYVSGGNASGDALQSRWRGEPSSIYEFSYENGKFSDKPVAKLYDTVDSHKVWWGGVAFLPGGNLLYVANRSTDSEPSYVAVFDSKTRQIVTRIPVEVNPYETLLSRDNKYLFVSNWSSQSVSVIDTASNKVIRTLHVGLNPNDMKLSSDGRLFVACSNDNSIFVIDTRKLQVVERIITSLTPLAPEGSTPNALAIDDTRKLLYIANADNNSVAVANISNRDHSNVIGFIPTGWYPSALALANSGTELFIGTSKGEQSYSDRNGPYSPFAKKNFYNGDWNVHAQPGSLEVVSVADLKAKLPHWTHQVIENTPYNDSLLSEAHRPLEPSIIPQQVGAGSPIKHVIYVIKENRTYDQIFGDLPKANGDPALAIFGEKVTPNQHALAKEYVTLDNLYCDGEVSVDGHSWMDAAYATDFNEKQWPALYGGWSTWNVTYPEANLPASGYLWDVARRKGLTYRSYGEDAERASTATTGRMAPNARGLAGHMALEFGRGLNVRDTTRVADFLREFKEYEANYDSPDPEKRLPNFIVMALPEDHTEVAKPGAYTPTAFIANADYAEGQLVEAITHSRYWPETAIFIMEDDGQDGSDHVDARRTVGLVISPYVKRGIVDSTLYSTSSMVRSIELLLGLPPMSQYDAAAMPVYASFGMTPVMTPYTAIPPQVDVNARNPEKGYGAKESSRMDFSDVDRIPMRLANEIIWKSVKGADSPMPPPVHRFRPLIDATDSDHDDDRSDSIH